jgi:hypothetical protein
MAATLVSVPGSHRFDLTVHGHHKVMPALGNDTVASGSRSMKVVLGVGHDTVAPLGPPASALGRAALPASPVAHSTAIANGNTAQGHAAVGHAVMDHAAPGKMTLLGGAGREFSGGATIAGLNKEAKALERVSTLTGHDTMLGGKNTDTLGFLKGQHGSAHLIQDFVTGQSKLHLTGASLESLKSAHDSAVSSHGGNTYISLDGGKTTIALHGIAHLKADPHRH